MTGILLILRSLFALTFAVKGFAMAQDGKVNNFLKIVFFLGSSHGSNMRDHSKLISKKLKVSKFWTRKAMNMQCLRHSSLLNFTSNFKKKNKIIKTLYGP